MAEQQAAPIDWAGEAKHLYRLAARWGDRGKPDVTYKYDKGDKQ